MGVKIFDIVPKREIDFNELSGKTIAVDGNLTLYQFLSSIRQMDGSLLTDSKGNVTSHLSGLFFRTSRMLGFGIRPCFVFDGKPPELKLKERERRKARKEEAMQKYEEAASSGSIAQMRKYAARTTRLTKEMVDEAKELISALGLPVIQAPSEGEAQAACLVKNNDAYAVGSQDGDSFLFGATRLVKNLTLSTRRKMPGKLGYSKISPELISLSEILNTLGIEHDQLIALGMLVGTDYNNGGIKGIGPKNALKLVKKHGTDFDSMFREVKWEESFDVSWEEIFNLIKHIPTTSDYSLRWSGPDIDKVEEILCEKHEFSSERINNALDKLKKEETGQKGLNEFF